MRKKLNVVAIGDLYRYWPVKNLTTSSKRTLSRACVRSKFTCRLSTVFCRDLIVSLRSSLSFTTCVAPVKEQNMRTTNAIFKWRSFILKTFFEESHVNRKKVLQKQQILNVSLNFKVWNTKDKRELCWFALLSKILKAILCLVSK